MNTNIFRRTFTPAVALLAAAAAPAAPAAQDLVAVKAGRVIPIEGEELRDAVILIENGLITAVGRGLEIPWNADVVDASDKVVMPAWVIAQSSGGMDRENEQMPVTPFVSVRDAIDPVHDYFDQALRDGIGAVHVIPGDNCLVGGRGLVVRPAGRTVEDMTLSTSGGMKVSFHPTQGGRAGHVARLRRVFEELEQHVKDLEQRRKEFEEEQKLPSADSEAEFEEDVDAQRKPLVDLVDGKITAYVSVPGPAELREALRLIKKYRLKAVLVLGPECYRVAHLVRESGLPVVLDGTMEYRETDPETEEETVVCPAKVFFDEGIRFALSHAWSPRGFAGLGAAPRYPWWQAAVAVRHGVPKEAALRAFTIEPARVLGLEDRIGSIAPGKEANLQILTGDPLAAATWVDKVLLEGRVAYDRSRDVRLQNLLARPEPPAPAGEGEEGEEGEEGREGGDGN